MNDTHPLMQALAVMQQRIDEQQMAVRRSQTDLQMAELGLSLELDELNLRREQYLAVLDTLPPEKQVELVINRLSEGNE